MCSRCRSRVRFHYWRRNQSIAQSTQLRLLSSASSVSILRIERGGNKVKKGKARKGKARKDKTAQNIPAIPASSRQYLWHGKSQPFDVQPCCVKALLLPASRHSPLDRQKSFLLQHWLTPAVVSHGNTSFISLPS